MIQDSSNKDKVSESPSLTKNKIPLIEMALK